MVAMQAGNLPCLCGNAWSAYCISTWSLLSSGKKSWRSIPPVVRSVIKMAGATELYPMTVPQIRIRLHSVQQAVTQIHDGIPPRELNCVFYRKKSRHLKLILRARYYWSGTPKSICRPVLAISVRGHQVAGKTKFMENNMLFFILGKPNNIKD